VSQHDQIPVVCAIIEDSHKILAAQRNVNQSNAGLWEFPGGKVHPGETPSQALIREICEELNIHISDHRPLEPVSFQYPWISIKLIPFICRITAGEPVSLEHAQIGYFSREECKNLSWAPADILVLEQYWGKEYKFQTGTH